MSRACHHWVFVGLVGVVLSQHVTLADNTSNLPSTAAAKDPAVVQNITDKYYKAQGGSYHLVSNSDAWQQATPEWSFLKGGSNNFASVDLVFSFPFYGLRYRQIQIASAGFISLSPEDGVSLKTYFVAPLLAAYDITSDTTVFYLSDQDKIIIQWDSPTIKGAPFKFQAILYKSGRISFFYEQIGMSISQVRAVSRESHVEAAIGLADAYQRNYLVDGEPVTVDNHYAETTIPDDLIAARHAVVFDPLPTCHSHVTCDACASHRTAFDCRWCPATEKCSDGVDRFRDAYLAGGCHSETTAISNSGACPPPQPSAERSFQLYWPLHTFSGNCWYWLSVRLDSDMEELRNKEEVDAFVEDKKSGVYVTWEMTLTDTRNNLIEEYLRNEAPLRCDGESHPIDGQVTETKSTASSSSLTTLHIVLIVLGSILLAILCIAVTFCCAWKKPSSSLGRWLQRHQSIIDCCCCAWDSDVEYFHDDRKILSPGEQGYNPSNAWGIDMVAWQEQIPNDPPGRQDSSSVDRLSAATQHSVSIDSGLDSISVTHVKLSGNANGSHDKTMQPTAGIPVAT